MAEQICKDCEGLGEWECYGKAYFCKTCDGAGEINRTGPYRLADGTWSDGVDRGHEIAALMFGIANPSRMSVNIDEAEGTFDVWRGTVPVKEFTTHAEAIAYADRMARTNQGENK